MSLVYAFYRKLHKLFSFHVVKMHHIIPNGTKREIQITHLKKQRDSSVAEYTRTPLKLPFCLRRASVLARNKRFVLANTRAAESTVDGQMGEKRRLPTHAVKYLQMCLCDTSWGEIRSELPLRSHYVLCSKQPAICILL